jgi:DNA-binding transcriptional regulator PaaX
MGTSTDARRHIREWTEFFRDAGEVSHAAVEEFIRSHRKQKHLKQSLRRLMARGFVRERKSKLELTREGIKFFKTRASRPGKPMRWDGKWRLVSFDVPGGYSVVRDRIRALLGEFGFYRLHKSVWICPNSVAKDFWKWMVEEELDGYCKAMVVDIIEGDEELRRHFGIG